MHMLTPCTKGLKNLNNKIEFPENSGKKKERPPVTWWFSRAQYVSSFFHKDLVKYKYAAVHFIHFEIRNFANFKSVYLSILGVLKLLNNIKQLHFVE